MRRRAGVVGGALLLVLLTPGTALAHGIGGRLDLPVPVTYFIAAAGVVIVISFVALALLWPEPRLQGGPRQEPGRLTVPRRGLLPVLGVIGLLLVIGQLVVAALSLTTDPTRPSIAPVLIWVVFWLIIPFTGALIGDWYSDLNPWRTIGRTFKIGRAERLWLRDAVGVLPAAALLLSFTWLELVNHESGSATALGWAALAYTVVMLGTMAYAGLETGLTVFDAFTPYNRLISSISPLGRRADGKLVWRGWLRALTVLPEWRGLALLVCVAIGTVTYDGASGTSWFKAAFGTMAESVPGGTLLLLASVALIAVAYWLASWVAARMVGGDWTANRVSARFAHTLVPIALAYAVAHYMTLIIFEGQQLIAAVSDPFALGWDLFGTADRKIDFFITTSEPIWYLQLAVIVTGHVTGVVLAHDRALGDFGPDAVRSQYAMLLLMVALTTLGLLILAG
ncbi:MAG TPA: hypothetical protein VI193_08985 [Acidimicrobiia bacterium]